jgi:hypothetical protein
MENIKNIRKEGERFKTKNINKLADLTDVVLSKFQYLNFFVKL